jgi:hypothetical protein
MKENLIIWVKWKDPWGRDFDPEEELDFDTDDEEEMEWDELQSKEDFPETFKLPKNIPVIATRMGPVPIVEDSMPSKNFNFWLGHSKVNITRAIAEKVSKIEGVECLEVFTRYRIRIAIGKAFAGNKVMSDIDKMIQEHMQAKEPVVNTSFHPQKQTRLQNSLGLVEEALQTLETVDEKENQTAD